ncbi:uncharacterized abhydrolase domain-containing protein DDB_G0269086-like [Gadus macrocephalus]|uniref:uncharacterized abhydrolase domain-containing protein DDB_G0269086-like n=1 Tax=Gadus macrocephalus TaxID=80720 RepID=UPI0028CB5EC0|nr:uncharacterized abhydrolase domain-containing protein DDB_G0269086-like [Gadus macrocephalus]
MGRGLLSPPMKVYALQSYVSDLTNQNQVLVEAVEDLEKEAQHKVSSVGMKLQPSDSIVHERMQQRWSSGRSACSLQPTGDTECRSAASSITPLLQPAGRVPRNPDIVRLEDWPGKAEGEGWRVGAEAAALQTRRRLRLAGGDPGRHAQTGQDSGLQEKHCQQLSLDNSQLPDSLAALQNKVQLIWRASLILYDCTFPQIVRLEDWPGKAEGEGWRVGAEAAALQTRRRLRLAGGDPGRHAQTGQDSGLQRVRHSEPDAVPQCRDSQGSIERALSVQEKHCQQLSLDNSQLPDSLAALQNKTSAWRVGDLNRSLGQERQPVHDQLQSTKESHQVQDQKQQTNQESPQTLPVQDQLQSTNLESTNQESWQVQDQLQSTNQESQQNQQIQDQLQKANQEVGRLRQELAHLRHTAEKKIQRREVKLAALVKELEERKKLGSDCQKESSSERLQREAAQLRAKMEERGRVCAGLARDKERLESDLARGHEERCAAHLEVRSREQLIIQLRAEMKATQQTHHRTLEVMSALQREVSRLTEDMGGRQEETCLLRGKVREQGEIAEQKEKERVQLHLQLCGCQQQVRSQAESVRQLTSDLEAVKAAHVADADHWGRRRGQLHSRSEQVSAQLAQSQARLRESEAEVTSLKESLVRAKAGRREAADKAYEGLMKTRDAELESAHRQLVGAREDLKEATACARKHEESVAILKQKYAVAIEKMQQVQGQADCMEEELCYSQQQLRDSLLATSAAKAQLAELDGQYREMFSQWEHSKEAQAQLTDELQANQSHLRESQAKVCLSEGLVVALNKQVDDLKQQTSMCERELILPGRLILTQTGSTSAFCLTTSSCRSAARTKCNIWRRLRELSFR